MKHYINKKIYKHKKIILRFLSAFIYKNIELLIKNKFKLIIRYKLKNI